MFWTSLVGATEQLELLLTKTGNGDSFESSPWGDPLANAEENILLELKYLAGSGVSCDLGRNAELWYRMAGWGLNCILPRKIGCRSTCCGPELVNHC